MLKAFVIHSAFLVPPSPASAEAVSAIIKGLLGASACDLIVGRPEHLGH